MRDANSNSEFARGWISAWNSHDLDRILSHYADTLTFSSPVLARLMPASHGQLLDRRALRTYWEKALALKPDLHFDLIAVMGGVNSVVIHYTGPGARLCAEYFRFSDDGKILESHAHSE